MWGEWFVQMVLEMLSYCTPPACVSSTIITVVESLFENPTAAIIIRELPSITTIREWRSGLVGVTKTLAANQLGKADNYAQFATDGTSWRQTSIQNAFLGILTKGGYKMITL